MDDENVDPQSAAQKIAQHMLKNLDSLSPGAVKDYAEAIAWLVAPAQPH